MGLSHWTIEDTVVLTQQASLLALMDDTLYCEHCRVVPINDGDKYCLGCAQEITDRLAEEYKERIAVERGLY